VALKQLTAPFPYFGGKRRAAELIWSRIGADVTNYVEPFCGSCAVLLARPGGAGKVETVNDIDGLLVNFWRAVKHDPETVAEYASWPVTELDLLARHDWLIGKRESITEGLRVDPDWFDAKAAGWWCWGANTWIGSGFGFRAADQIPHLGDAGTGVNRRLPHLGDAGKGVTEWMYGLCERLRYTRTVCGSWERVLSPSVTTKHGLTGVVLDPPYDAEGHGRSMYVAYGSVAKDVAEWCRENGSNPLFRIALCGYEGEHDLPGWKCEPWKARKGYGSDENTRRERIWFSPHCLSASLFDSGDW
jgi:DNA adenine methylase